MKELLLASAALLLLPACSSGSQPSTAAATSSSSSTGSGGGGGDGTGGAGGGGPIDAPQGKWTWVDFPDSSCANGSPTGIGINPGTSKEVVIFLNGGGACWNDITCYTLKTAVSLDGYGAADFASDAASLLDQSLFDRTDAKNPYKDDSYVFVPYCTGDVHAGDAIQMYSKPTYFKGRVNVAAYLKRLVPTFPAPSRVVLSGASAGGFGAGINWWRVREAWKSVRVDLIDDSGPPLSNMFVQQQVEAAVRDQWKLDDGAFPPDCTDCKTRLDALIDYYAANVTDARAALLSYTDDPVISQFFQITTDQFHMGIYDLATNHIDPDPKFKFFLVTGMSHVLVSDPSLATNGVTLKEWLSQMANDDPNWTSQAP